MKTTIAYPSLLVSLFFLLTSAGCNKNAEAVPAESVSGIPGTEGIYLHLEYRYGLGVEIYYRPHLMFKDGSVYKNLDTSPEKLDVAKSKQAEPAKWGTWKKQGNEITVAWNGGDTDTWKEKTWFKTVPAGKGEQISGTYRSLSGLSNVQLGGDFTAISAKSLSFSGDKFTYESTSGGGNSGVTAYNSQTKAGTYKLDGHTIEMRFNNGIVEKKFFYFYPDSKTVFGVGGNYYVQRN
jgi:hypothetical protein